MKTFQIVLQFFPYILAAVKAVEEGMQGASGSDKKTMVLNAVLAAAHVGETVPNGIVDAISHLIDIVVSTLNASGVFKKAA